MEKKNLELEIIAPDRAEPGEEIEVRAVIKVGSKKWTIRRLELVASIEWHSEDYGSGSRCYSFVDSLLPAGFFNFFRRPIGGYSFRDVVGRSPVRKIVLERYIELTPFAEKEYSVKMKLLAPRFIHPGYLWRLTLVARIPFLQDIVVIAWIEPIDIEIRVE